MSCIPSQTHAFPSQTALFNCLDVKENKKGVGDSSTRKRKRGGGAIQLLQHPFMQQSDFPSQNKNISDAPWPDSQLFNTT